MHTIYKYSYDLNNVDVSKVSVNSIQIIDEFDKQYFSTGIYGGVNYSISILDINYDVSTNGEIWQEGVWNGDHYDDNKNLHWIWSYNGS